MFRIMMVFSLLTGICAFAQNAPVSTVENISANQPELTVAVTATGFSNIGSCNLQLLYNPEIAMCIAVDKGSQLPGQLASNVSIPGVITLGWYDWPGVTLPDNSIIFKFTFSRVGNGTSPITWNEDYTDRQWSDGNFNGLNDLPFEDFYLNGSVTFLADNAPVTHLPILPGCNGETIDFPVIVNDFTNVGEFTLTLIYDPAVLNYQAFTNNSGFPGLTIDASVTGQIVAHGYTAATNGISLPGNSALFSLTFLVIEGVTNLAWFDNGASCEYKGPPPAYHVRNDVPKSSFYIDGSFITALSPSIIQQPVSSDTLVPGAGIAVFEVGASGDLLSHQWQEYIGSWENIEDGGVYQGAHTAEMTITNPPAGMDGYKYRCIVTGICEPQAITDGLATLHITMPTAIFTPEQDERILLSAFPNPFSGNFTLRFISPFAGEAQLTIYTIHGLEVLKLTDQPVVAGENTFSIVPEGKTAPGIYLAVMVIRSEEKLISETMQLIFKGDKH